LNSRSLAPQRFSASATGRFAQEKTALGLNLFFSLAG
jgi:hypothetical protein